MNTFKYIWCVCLTLVMATLVSCSDDDEKADNATISVSRVYLERADATVKDRPVDFVRLGQTIRIEGTGFKGLQKLYVNGYDTYFNMAYVTDNNILFQVNSNTPVTEADEEVRNTIRFVKKGTEFTYQFTIRAASPGITAISNTLPKAGEEVVVYGANLQETSKVTLPGGVELTGADITNAPETEDESGTWFSFIMPSGIADAGAIAIECANGTARSAEYFNNSSCMVLDFDGTGTQGYWSWSATGSMVNDEDLVDDPTNSGRGKVLQLVPERLLADGVAAGKPRASECWTAGNGNDMDDWSRMYQYIPETTPLTDVAFQFDIYVPDEWVGTGVIQLALINNFNFGGIGSDDDGSSNQVAFICPWLEDGKVVPFKTSGWQTVTVPFSDFNKYAALIEDGKTPTFKDVVDDRNGATYKNFGMGFVNKDFTLDGTEYASSVFSNRIYIDNWRVVPCKATAISDFPDEE